MTIRELMTKIAELNQVAERNEFLKANIDRGIELLEKSKSETTGITINRSTLLVEVDTEDFKKSFTKAKVECIREIQNAEIESQKAIEKYWK